MMNYNEFEELIRDILCIGAFCIFVRVMYEIAKYFGALS